MVITFTNKASSNDRMTIDNLSILTLGTATNESMIVDVVDEDADGPAHSGFNVDAALFTTNQFLPGGLVVTGLVMDAQSGVFASSNTWTLYSNAVAIASSFTMDPATDGAGIGNVAAGLSATLDGDLLNWVNGQFLLMVSTDFDADRPDDWTQTTNEFVRHRGIRGGARQLPGLGRRSGNGGDGQEPERSACRAAAVVTNPITGVPIKGTDYAVNDAIGDATVAYAVPAPGWRWWCPCIPQLFPSLRSGETTYSAAYAEPAPTPSRR